MVWLSAEVPASCPTDVQNIILAIYPNSSVGLAVCWTACQLQMQLRNWSALSIPIGLLVWLCAGCLPAVWAGFRSWSSHIGLLVWLCARRISNCLDAVQKPISRKVTYPPLSSPSPAVKHTHKGREKPFGAMVQEELGFNKNTAVQSTITTWNLDVLKFGTQTKLNMQIRKAFGLGRVKTSVPGTFQDDRVMTTVSWRESQNKRFKTSVSKQA